MVQESAVSAKKIIRITVVGDGDTGKTSMLIRYKDKKFDLRYLPTVFDSYSMMIPIDGIEHNIILNDTAGQEEFDKLRLFAYKNTDVFIICYAVDNETSYQNVFHLWAPELKKHCPTAKIVLAGTKFDLVSRISESDGSKLAEKINAAFFILNSAKDNYNINETIQMALVAALKGTVPKKAKKKICTLL